MESPSNLREVKLRLEPLERRVLTQLLKLKLKGESWVVATSGGLDSVVLAHVLCRIAHFGQWKLVLGHIHHGSGADLEQTQYRDRALKHVEMLGRRWNLPVISRKADTFLKTEAEARKFRQGEFEKLRAELGAMRVVQGHHRDDLLETRMIRLIRGTGAQGLRAMNVVSGSILRPFLKEPRKELMSYAASFGLTWVEDPSNANQHYLRNWIRTTWLQGLEQKRPGGMECFAESLDLIVRELDVARAGSSRMEPMIKVDLALDHGSIQWSRAAFVKLGDLEQAQLVAEVYRRLEAKGFSRRHVREAVKRIDSTRHRLEFHVGGLEFALTREQISCRRI